MAVDSIDESTAVTLTGSTAGRDIDIHIGHKIYTVPPLTEENYDDLIAQATPLLHEKDFDSAYRLLQKIPDNISQAGYANLLKALALLAGRSFSAIHPTEREKVEKYLISAQRKMMHELIPLVLLAILEIDYYNYHGQASLNNISSADVAQKIKMKPLSQEDIQLLRLLKVSRDARNKLGLYF